MRYFRLLDKEHEGIIVKAEGRLQYEFDPSAGWVRSGILSDYFCDWDPLYDMYEEISEEEALRITEQQFHKN